MAEQGSRKLGQAKINSNGMAQLHGKQIMANICFPLIAEVAGSSPAGRMTGTEVHRGVTSIIRRSQVQVLLFPRGNVAQQAEHLKMTSQAVFPLCLQAPVAQGTERRSSKPQAGGSNPLRCIHAGWRNGSAAPC